MNALPHPKLPEPPPDDRLRPERDAARTPADTSTRRRAGRSATRALWVVALCVSVAALRLGRDLLIPLAVALLMALLLSGIVETLRRYRVPRGLSALVLLLLVGLALGGLLHAVWAPARDWMESAPRVLRTIEHKTRGAQSLLRRFDALAKRASAIAGAAENSGSGLPVAAPAAGSVSAMDVVEGTSGVAGALLMGVALTLLLLAAGPPTVARMTAPVATDGRAVRVLRIIDAVRLEVGRYYGMLAVINLVFGTATALVMWLLGMPNPVLWGAVAAVLNFIPYLGCATTLVILTLVAFVSFDRISQTLLVPASFLLMAGIEGHIIEPVLLGRRLDLNPIVVLVALWVGAWTWGIAGMVVAMPILVATKVAAAHSENGTSVVRFLSPPRARPRRTWSSGFTDRRW